MGNNNSIATQTLLRKVQDSQHSSTDSLRRYHSANNLHRVSFKDKRRRSISSDLTMSWSSSSKRVGTLKSSNTAQRKRIKPSTRQIAAELANKQSTDELLAAVIRGDEEAVIRLLDHGTDVNSIDGNHLTALHYAAMHAKPRMIDILISYGADVDYYDLKGGFTPLHWVVINCHPGMSEEKRVDECILSLVRAGCNVNCKDFNQATPLHFAARTDNKTIVDSLMRLGADPNEVDVLGRTCAAVAKSADTKILIIKLADLRARAFYHVLEIPSSSTI